LPPFTAGCVVVVVVGVVAASAVAVVNDVLVTEFLYTM